MPAVVVRWRFHSGDCRSAGISARPWRDGELIGYACARTGDPHRHPPVLVESGRAHAPVKHGNTFSGLPLTTNGVFQSRVPYMGQIAR